MLTFCFFGVYRIPIDDFLIDTRVCGDFVDAEGSERQCVVGEACLQEMCHSWHQQRVKLFGWMPSIDDHSAICDESFDYFLGRLAKDKMFITAFSLAVAASVFATVLIIAIVVMKEKEQWYEKDYEDWEFEAQQRWDPPTSASHGPKWLPIVLYILLTLCTAALFSIWTNYVLRFEAKSSIKFGFALESTSTVFYFMTLFIGGIVLWRELFTRY